MSQTRLRGGFVDPKAAAAFRSHYGGTLSAAAALRALAAAALAAALVALAHRALPWYVYQRVARRVRWGARALRRRALPTRAAAASA